LRAGWMQRVPVRSKNKNLLHELVKWTLGIPLAVSPGPLLPKRCFWPRMKSWCPVLNGLFCRFIRFRNQIRCANGSARLSSSQRIVANISFPHSASGAILMTLTSSPTRSGDTARFGTQIAANGNSCG
jgi:hypothetical protein